MIDNLIPTREGIILIELPPLVTSTKDGFALYTHANADFRFHPKYGTVLAIPEGEKDLIVGDQVFFSYLVLHKASMRAHEGFLVKEEERRAVLTPKENLFFIKRGEEIIPLNGFSLIKPSDNVKQGIGGFAVLNKPKLSEIEGTIIVTKHPELKSGDMVLIETNSNTPLEYEMSATMENVYRTRDEEIVAKMKDKLKL